MSKQDRSLLVKFMSGDSRIKPGERYTLEIGYGYGDFPTAGTCGLYMQTPHYDDKETFERNLLTAIRLCGEIDDDGGVDYYDEEVDYGNEDRGSDAGAAGSDDNEERPVAMK